MQLSSPMKLVSNLERLLKEKENNLPRNFSDRRILKKKRKELSIIVELGKGHLMKEIKVGNIERRYNIQSTQGLTEVKEIIKQQMQAKA